MKLFFDARWTRTDYYDGISRYGSSLIEALHDQGVDVTMLIFDKKQLNLLPKNVPYLLVNNPVSIRELFIARILNEAGADVVFSPLQVMGAWGRKYKLILTLQDIIYYKYPQAPTFLPLFVRVIWRLFHLTYWPQRWLLNTADAVATVSKTSKKYIEKFRLSSRPVTVVYNAPQPIDLPKKSPVTTKNILYMGSFMPYKNVETLIEGMRYLPGEFTLHLLSKIADNRRAELEALIPDGAAVVFHNGVSEEEYYSLLASAYAQATASHIEGFGLSIVEAQNFGIPVVCSDTDIFHEVAGDGALYFDDDNPQGFAAKIDSLKDATLRKKLITAGHIQAAKFSWDSSARVIYKLAQQLTGTQHTNDQR